MTSSLKLFRGSAPLPQTHYHTCILKVLVLNLENDIFLQGTVYNKKEHKNKCKKHFPKMQGWQCQNNTPTRKESGSCGERRCLKTQSICLLPNIMLVLTNTTHLFGQCHMHCLLKCYTWASILFFPFSITWDSISLTFPSAVICNTRCSVAQDGVMRRASTGAAPEQKLSSF